MKGGACSRAPVSRIAVAGEDGVARRRVRQIVAGDPDLVLAVDAPGLPALLDELRRGSPVDAVIVSTGGIEDRDTLEALGLVRARWPGLPLIVEGLRPGEALFVQVVRAGTEGVVDREAPPEHLLTALRDVLAGDRYVSPGLEACMSEARSALDDPPSHAFLSPRELQVLRLLASGLTVSAIARQLRLSVKTISTYRSRLMGKMGMTADSDLARYAAEHDLT